MEEVSFNDIDLVEHFIHWMFRKWQNPEAAFRAILAFIEKELPRDVFIATLKTINHQIESYLKQFE